LGASTITIDPRSSLVMQAASVDTITFPDNIRGDFIVALNWSGVTGSLGGGGPGITYTNCTNGGSVTSSFSAGNRAEWYLVYVSVTGDDATMTFNSAGVFPLGTNSCTIVISQIPRVSSVIPSEIFDRNGEHADERYNLFMESVQRSSIEALGKMLAVPVTPELRDSLSNQLAEKMKIKSKLKYNHDPVVIYHGTNTPVPGFKDISDSSEDDCYTIKYNRMVSDSSGTYGYGKWCDNSLSYSYRVVTFKPTGGDDGDRVAVSLEDTDFDNQFRKMAMTLSQSDFIFAVKSIIKMDSDSIDVEHSHYDKTDDHIPSIVFRKRLAKVMFKQEGHRLQAKRNSVELPSLVNVSGGAVKNNTNGEPGLTGAPNGL